MFTGIIETMATLRQITTKGSNKTFLLSSPITSQLKVDQSLSHNGVCLTVESINGDEYQVTAIAETLQKTNLGDWKTGDSINLERCLQPTGRLDGHFVQGHTDSKGLVIEKTDLDGSWQFTFRFDKAFAPYIIEKGSIAVNGISLTAFNVKDDQFSVGIIPYTYEYTNLHLVHPGDTVNLEFDMLGKYFVRWININGRNS
ncbi:MAG: riboflavin synthase [Chitinophagaceae bacterium]